MMNPFHFMSPFWGWLKKALDKSADLVAQVTPDALKVVKAIAGLTETRTDDDIIRVFEEFAVPGAQDWLSLPVEKRGAALIHVAVAVLKRSWAHIPTGILRTAIEIALLAFRNKPVQ